MRLHFDWWALNRGGTGAPDDDDGDDGDEFVMVKTTMVAIIVTRSFAALRAADLDWIVGPGYSLGG